MCASVATLALSALTSPAFAQPTEQHLPPPSFAYWSAAERTQSGELTLAAPRRFDGDTLAPLRDDKRSTTAFLQGFYARTAAGSDADGFSLVSIHDLPASATMSTNFHVDSRERTAISGVGKATLPLPGRAHVHLVPTLGVGAGGDFDPLVITGVELWTDRRQPVGATVLTEVTRWTHDRTRVLGELAALERFGRRVALEQRVAVGVWAGSEVAGEAALRITSAALQELGRGFGLYERATLSRGLIPTTKSPVPTEGRLATDLSLGVRRTFGKYGIAVQMFQGAQAKHYERWGGELTVYGTLF